jgi:hypothetical protein
MALTFGNVSPGDKEHADRSRLKQRRQARAINKPVRGLQRLVNTHALAEERARRLT